MAARAADPLGRFARWWAEAGRRGADREVMALATAAPGGAPSVRFVLLKQVDRRGLAFFTDARSRKGHELARNPRAAIALYWGATHRQVRIEGRIERVSPAEADAYWRTRPRGSRLEARASRQSAPLGSRDELIARWQRLRTRYRGRAIPRPPTWTGFRLVPERIEFWTHRASRLHERELFVRTARGWTRTFLQP